MRFGEEAGIIRTMIGRPALAALRLFADPYASQARGTAWSDFRLFPNQDLLEGLLDVVPKGQRRADVPTESVRLRHFELGKNILTELQSQVALAILKTNASVRSLPLGEEKYNGRARRVHDVIFLPSRCRPHYPRH